MQRIIIISPHTDDGEFGCGGTIARLIEEKKEVFYVAFSACTQSIKPDYPSNILTIEVKQSTSELRIPKENVILFDYEVRTFDSYRQAILQQMIDLRQDIQPDTVFLPSREDIHQDHSVIVKEGFRAFKFCNILCYEIPWNNFEFQTSSFVCLQARHIQKKIDAIQFYRSQSHRSYMDKNFIWSLARTRGEQIGVQLAETFHIERWIIR